MLLFSSEDQFSPKPFPSSARQSQRDAALATSTPESKARVKASKTIAQVCKGREAGRTRWRLGLCPPQPRSAGLAPAARPPHIQLTHHVREGSGGRSRGIGAVLEVRVVARRGSREGSGACVGRECGARRRAAELIRAGPRNDAGAVCGARVERQRGGRLVQVALRVGHGHTRAWGAPRRGGQRAGRRPARASERAPGLWLPRAAALRAPAPGLRPAAPPGWLPARLRLRPPRPLLCAPRLPGLGFLSPRPPSLFAPGGSAFGFAKVLPRC